MVPGTGICRSKGGSGTLGCLVRSVVTHRVHGLTAGHVLLKKDARAGDGVFAPGSGGRTQRCIGALEGWTDPLSMGPDNFTLDAALITAGSADPPTATIPGLGVPRGRSDDLLLGTKLQIVGAGSGHSKGWVVDLSYDSSLTLPVPGRGSVLCAIKGLVLCNRFTCRGDSGAAVLNDQLEIVGIHIGSTRSGSFFCRIRPICEELKIEVVTKEP